MLITDHLSLDIFLIKMNQVSWHLPGIPRATRKCWGLASLVEELCPHLESRWPGLGSKHLPLHLKWGYLFRLGNCFGDCSYFNLSLTRLIFL